MRNKKLNTRVLARFPRIYKTRYGQAFYGDSLEIMKSIPAESINLVVTSPPFALLRKKSYGNVKENLYVEWFRPFATEIHRILTKDGSFVLDLGGSWIKGEPIRSLYHFELLLDLCKSSGLFKLAQEFYWFNPAKMPGPAEWVTIRRIRVKDAVNTIWWLSKSSNPKASNRWVLSEYKEDMNQLFKHGYNQGPRPSEHHVSKVWNRDNGGAIPPNIIIKANTRSNDPYLIACKKFGYSPNPARFVDAIPDFFIRFLTRPNDLVLDPFAGSNVVGYIAEQHRRRWISIEIVKDYIAASRFRFKDVKKLNTV